MLNKVFNRISLPLASLLLAVLGAVCLGAALIAQYGFNLHPCHLCIIQRIPFAILIALGLIGFLMHRFATWTVGLGALTLLTNAGIALFHSGVERKWWAGLTGCSAPDMSGSVEELMARIESIAPVRCDEIPWALFGLSMANYNVLLCGAAGILCCLYLRSKCPPRASAKI